MAGIARCFRVLTLQFESRQIVVELGRAPAVFVVTINTTEAKASFVRIVIAMTGIAILQSHRKIAQPARACMALRAFEFFMPANDLE